MADYTNAENINCRLFQHLRFNENEQFKSLLLNNKKELIKTYDTIGTLLHYAAYCSNAEIAQHLIELGIDIDCKGPDGKTALALAVESQCAATVKVLLDAGANIDISDDFGDSPLENIFKTYETMSDILQLFLKRVRAEAATIKEAVKRLADAGCTLYHAAFSDDFQLIRSMSNDIDVNSKSKSNGGKPALFAAVELNDLNLAEWLIEIGADVNAKDGYQVSVLSLSYKKTIKWLEGRSMALIKLLLEEGANPNVESHHHHWPLVFSVISHVFDKYVDTTYLTEYFELLLEHDAIPRNPVQSYFTIFDYALMDKSLNMDRSLIAQLALLKKKARKRGMSIDESVVRCKSGENQPKLDELAEYRKLCERILGVVVFETLTLFQLLTDSEISDCKMKMYARNEIFVGKIKEVCLEKEMDKLYPYYYKMLMKRINKAVDLLELENIAIPIVCRLMNCNENECYIVARTIVSYLNARNLRKLVQI